MIIVGWKLCFGSYANNFSIESSAFSYFARKLLVANSWNQRADTWSCANDGYPVNKINNKTAAPKTWDVKWYGVPNNNSGAW